MSITHIIQKLIDIHNKCLVANAKVRINSIIIMGQHSTEKDTETSGKLSLNKEVLSVAANNSNKFALIIGNSEYDGKYAKKLPCCKRDAQEIEKSLKLMCFTTIKYNNMNNNIMIEEFKANIINNATIFVYFSGHGCSKNGKCFMLPTDYNKDTTTFNGDEYYCVNSLVESLEEKFLDSAIIVVLDCCRSEKAKNIEEHDTVILPEDVVPGSAYPDIKGSIIAYSCKEGTPSYTGRIVSPFTECILNNIYRPIDISRIFRLCNYELSVHPQSASDSQESRYVDALRSPKDLILNANMKITNYTMARSNVICKKDANSPAIWAAYSESNEDSNASNYYSIPQNSEIEVLIQETDWILKMNAQVVITSERSTATLDDDSEFDLPKGSGFPLTGEENENYIVENTSRNMQNIVSTVLMKIPKEYCKIVNNDYWVKIRVTDNNYIGYIAGTNLPEYLRQTLLPYFVVSNSFWSS